MKRAPRHERKDQGNTGNEIKYSAEAIPFVAFSKPTTLFAAARIIGLFLKVQENLKAFVLQLREEKKLLDRMVFHLADDKARVDAWEKQFKIDPEKYPEIGWLVREQPNAMGERIFYAVCAPALPDEPRYGTWRECMDAQIRFTAAFGPKPVPEPPPAVAVDAGIAEGDPSAIPAPSPES